MVNEEIRRVWETTHRHDPEAAKRLKEIEATMSRVRGAIDEGVADPKLAKARLEELSLERQKLSAVATVAEPPPVVTVEEAMSYRRQVEKIFSVGTMIERKSVARLGPRPTRPLRAVISLRRPRFS